MSSEDQKSKQCRRKVKHLLGNSAKVKTLLKALDQAKCPLNPHRHIAIEDCGWNTALYGGLDRDHMQIVLCSNRSEMMETSRLESILVHELIHLYDVCTAHVDFDDLSHLACTEIRAANLAHCSFSVMAGRFRHDHHEHCVKSQALDSMQAMKPHLLREELKKTVDKVYLKCVNDLEPFGRLCQRSKLCNQRVLNEFKTFFLTNKDNPSTVN